MKCIRLTPGEGQLGILGYQGPLPMRACCFYKESVCCPPACTWCCLLQVERFRNFFLQKAPFAVEGSDLRLEHVSCPAPTACRRLSRHLELAGLKVLPAWIAPAQFSAW
jgi:hypothetical protein